MSADRLSRIAAWASVHGGQRPTLRPRAAPVPRPAAQRDEVRAAILADRDASDRAIARQLGVDGHLVGKVRRSMGLAPKPRGWRNNTARDAAIAAAIADGTSCRAAGAPYDLSPSRAHQIARAAKART